MLPLDHVAQQKAESLMNSFTAKSCRCPLCPPSLTLALAVALALVALPSLVLAHSLPSSHRVAPRSRRRRAGNTHHTPELVRPAVERMLRELWVESIDLLLTHWPTSTGILQQKKCVEWSAGWGCDGAPNHVPLEATWRALEAVVDAGLGAPGRGLEIRGEAPELLESKVRTVPATNQVELHPCLQQQELLDFCKRKGIAVTAHSPIGSPGNAAMRVKNQSFPTLIRHPEVIGLACARLRWSGPSTPSGERWTCPAKQGDRRESAWASIAPGPGPNVDSFDRRRPGKPRVESVVESG